MKFNIDQFSFDPMTKVLAAEVSELRIAPGVAIPRSIYVQGRTRTVRFFGKGFDGASWTFEPDHRAGGTVSSLVIFNT